MWEEWDLYLPHVCLQGTLEQIQSVLNSTEVGLHQLTALVDCRSLHMVSHFVCCGKNLKSNTFLHNSLQFSFLPCRTTSRLWLGCATTVLKVSFTWFSSLLSLLWCSLLLCAVCHTPGLARGNAQTQTHTQTQCFEHYKEASDSLCSPYSIFLICTLTANTMLVLTP